MKSWIKTYLETFSPFFYFSSPECLGDMIWNLFALVPCLLEILSFPIAIPLAFIHDLLVFPLFRGGDI